MKIIWHGHSCFEITGNDGTIVFDPYQENSVPGLNSLKLKANLVLCSHEHEDHNARNCVEITSKDFKVTRIETYHDHHQGSHRGKNTIHIVEFEDMKIVHMGDIGCMIDDISKLKHCDVLMIPIGGYYTIDTKEALKYIECIQPRIVIPMHYRGFNFGYDVLSTNEEFIQNSSNVHYVDDYLEVNKETRGQTVIFNKVKNLNY